jgi:MFS family permease
MSLATTKTQRKLGLVLYAVIAFLYWAALYIYAPTLPLYAKSLSDDLALIGFALSLYGLGHIVIRLPLGIAAAWFGHAKQFILIGLFLVGSGALVMGLSSDIRSLAIGRSITGIAAGTWVPLVLVYTGLFPVEKGIRATTMLTLVGSLARLAASTTTGLLNEFGGYHLSFFVAAALAWTAILVLLPANKDSHPVRRISMREIRQIISRREVLAPSLLSAIAQHSDWGITFSFLPILGKQLGGSDLSLSFLLTLYLLMFVLGNLAAATLTSRFGLLPVVAASFIVLSSGVGILFIIKTLPWVFITQAFVGLAQGVCHPVLMGMSIQYTKEEERPIALGLHQNVYAIGMFTGPWLSGIFAGLFGFRSTFGLTAVTSVALSGVLIYSIRQLFGNQSILQKVREK